MENLAATEVLNLTARIVAAHVENNLVALEAVPGLIHSVYNSLATAGAPEPAQARAQDPAVPVKRSVFPDYIICLEDGKRLKMLKRHLQTSYGMTPADYRVKWGLPLDYPMVAPSYASTRSSLAKSLGLGRKRSAVQTEPASNESAEAQSTPDEPDIVGKARRARDSRG